MTRQDGLWISLREDRELLKPLSTVATESLAPNETIPIDLPKQDALPGVPDERRFHRLYPDIVVPNELIRENLRMDHLRETFEATETHADQTCHLELGHARGSQYKLHRCLLSVSAAAQEKLQVTLLRKSPIVPRSDEQAQHFVKLAFDSAPVIVHSFTSPILQVHACTGIPNSFFVVRTQQEVHCISVELDGERKYADFRMTRHFTIDRKTLHGQEPQSCILSYKTFLKLVVITMDKMRVWISEDITSRTATIIRFKLHRTMCGLPSTVFSLIPCFSEDRESELTQLLLISRHMVDLTELTEETIRSILILEPSEVIFSLKTIESPSAKDKDYFVILTNYRVIFTRLVKTMEVVLSWKHYRKGSIHMSILTPAFDSSVHLLLYSKVDGLCTVFVAGLSSNPARISRPFRLNFEGSAVPTCILSYSCASSEGIPSSVVGLLHLTLQNALSSTVYSCDTDISNCGYRNKRILGSALVMEDVDSEDSTSAQRKVVRALLGQEQQTSLDLSQWYRDHLHSGTHFKARNREIDPRTTFSRPLQLGYELSRDENGSQIDADSNLEKMVDSHIGEHKFADTTPGLRIYDHAASRSDSEAYSAFALERLMRVWKGDPALAIGRHRQVAEAEHDHQVHLAAQALALSTAMFSETIMSDALPIRLADLCVIPRASTNGRTLSRILGEWDVEKDPDDYVWHNIESEPVKPFETSDIVPAIPSFAGTRNAPPVLRSSQYVPPVVSSTQGQHLMSSQGDSQITMTQPVAGKFGDRKQKKRKKAGF